MSKTPSRKPRLLPNIEEISRSARSRLGRVSSIRERGILDQGLLSVQFEDPDTDLFGHSKHSDDKKDEGKVLHEELHDNGQRSRNTADRPYKPDNSQIPDSLVFKLVQMN